jgi:RNA polymerase sigma-70 factor (ECF subfamily)
VQTFSLLHHDSDILAGLKANYKQRTVNEKILYNQYAYFIDEGCRKQNITYDESFSAYSDAVLSAIHNIINNHFDGRSSIKTYLYQIFCNKCIDLIRKNTTNKHQVHKTMPVPEMMNQLPDGARTSIERLMHNELKEKIKTQLSTIGKKCKDLLLMFEDGLTDKEIAQELSYNNAAVVKTTRLRCLEKLREKVAER